MPRTLLILFVALGLLSNAALAQTIDTSNVYNLHGYQQCLTNQAMQDSQGNIYITASVENTTFTEKWTSGGIRLWTEQFPMSGASLMAVDNASGTVYIAGGHFPQGPFVHAITSGGSSMWTYTDNNDEAVQALCLDGNGNVYAAMRYYDFSGNFGFDLHKIDGASGALTWKERKLYLPPTTACSELAADSAGHLYGLAKMTDSSNVNSYGVISFNPVNGQDLWRHGVLAYSGAYSVVAQAIYIAPGGNLDVLAGATDAHSKPLVAFYGFDSATGNYTNRTTEAIPNDLDAKPPLIATAQDAAGNLFYGHSNYNYNVSQYGAFSATGTPGFARQFAMANRSNRLFSPQIGDLLILNDFGLTELDSTGATIYTSVFTPIAPLPFLGLSNGNFISFGSVLEQTNFGLGIYNSSGGIAYDDFPTGPISGETNCAASDPQGNLYVATQTEPESLLNQTGPLFVSRLYPNLKPYWTVPFPIASPGFNLRALSLKYYSSSSDLLLLAQQEDSNNGYIPVPLVAKFSTAGNVLWSVYDSGLNAFYYDVPQAVEDGQGNVIAVGTDGFDNTMVVTCYSSVDGSVKWRYERPGATCVGLSVAIDGSGNIYACGRTFGNNAGLAFLKLTSAGAIVYNEFSPYGNSNAEGASMVCDAAGNQYVAYVAPGELHFWKLDSHGTAQFRQTYAAGSTPYAPYLGNVLYDSATSSVYLAVSTIDSSNNPELLVDKVGLNGVLAWHGTYLSPGQSFFTPKITLDSAGNVLAMARQLFAGSSENLAKFNGSTGSVLWSYGFDTAAGAMAKAVLDDITPLAAGKFFVVGAAPDTAGQVTSNACAAVMH